MGNYIYQLLKISNKENYYGCKILIDVLVSAIVLYLCQGLMASKVTGHLLFLFWISAAACQLYTLHYDRNCQFLFYETPFLKKGFIKITFAALTESVVLFLMNIWIVLSAFPGKTGIRIPAALVHFFFALFLGEMMGSICKRRVYGLSGLALFYSGMLYVSTAWPQAELFRPVSPVLQLYNLERNNAGSTAFLCVLTLNFFLWGIMFFNRGGRKRIVLYPVLCLVGVLAYGSVFMYEMHINQRTMQTEWKEICPADLKLSVRAVSEKDGLIFENVIQDIQLQADKLGFGTPVKEIYVQKYYISPLPFYQSRSIPFMLTDHRLQVNIISDAMLNWEDASLSSNMLFRCYGQLYMNKSSGNSYADKIRKTCQFYILYQTAVKGENRSYSQELILMLKEYCEQTHQYMRLNDDICVNTTIQMLEKNPDMVREVYSMVNRVQPADDQAFHEIAAEICPEIF